MPKKGAFTHANIIDGALLFKNNLIKNYGSGERVALPSDKVWTDLSKHFDYGISAAALHVFVKSNRGGILNILGLVQKAKFEQKSEDKSNEFPMNTICSSSSEYTTDDQSELPCKSITITLSPEEWKTIEPVPTNYQRQTKLRSYMTLPKGEWSHIIAEHFWEHTHLQCCLTFKRAKVHTFGQYYVSIVGRCKTCSSTFKGVIHHKPAPNSRVIIECKYVGDFYAEHDKREKRRMTKAVKETHVKNMLDDGKSSEFIREEEALRLIKQGKPEPPIIPTGNALRIAKSKELKSRHRHSDSVTAIMLMKMEYMYKDCLHDIGLDPFFLHFYTSEQIHLYRAYSRQCSIPSLIVDATGNVVKRFSKLGLKKTQIIYLYEAVVYDDKQKHTFTVSSMISEKHDNIAIYHWLSTWLKNDIPSPKEACSDMSLALLSALVRSLTQYSSLNDYISVCAQLLLQNVANNSIWLPRCFIRIDIAHFIKNITKWAPLATTSKKVKEVYLRAICLIIKCQSLIEIRSILISIYTVASNESDGYNILTGHETKCELHKKKILEAISNPFTNIELNDLILNSENLESSLIENENGLDVHINPLMIWASSAYEESQHNFEEGSGMNALYLPSIIPLLKKEIKLLPLWSGVMIPIFGYGNQTKSSAAVESMFNKTKNIIFKDIELPTSLETFMERRLISLKGSALLHNGEYPNTSISVENPVSIDNDENDGFMESVENCTPKSIMNNELSLSVDEDVFPVESDVFPVEFDLENQMSTNSNGEELSEEDDDMLSAESDQSFLNGYKTKSQSCKSQILSNVTVPNEKESNDSLLKYYTIQNLSPEIKIVIKDTKNENKSNESWNRKKTRNTKSYLSVNPHLKFLDLNSKKNCKSLPLLKNGSRAEDLKALSLKGHGHVILTNTCAFDTAVFLLMVAMCDSDPYFKLVDQLTSNVFIIFIKSILSNGITVGTYRKRAQIIIDKQSPEHTPLKYNQSLFKCETTFSNLIRSVIPELPTVREDTVCASSTCLNKVNKYGHISYIYDDKFDTLEKFIQDRLEQITITCNKQKSDGKCNAIKTITPQLSNQHIFIEVLLNCEDSVQDPVSVKLADIPPIIKVKNNIYKLRGVCSFTGGNLLNIGHYKAYCKRENEIWELFDDLALKSIPVNGSTTIQCEYLFYTV